MGVPAVDAEGGVGGEVAADFGAKLKTRNGAPVDADASRQMHAHDPSQRNKRSQPIFSTTTSFDRDMPNALM
jgi:hypothetical protein